MYNGRILLHAEHGCESNGSPVLVFRSVVLSAQSNEALGRPRCAHHICCAVTCAACCTCSVAVNNIIPAETLQCPSVSLFVTINLCHPAVGDAAAE